MSQSGEADLAEVIREFLVESNDNLEHFESFLLEAERDPSAKSALAGMFRCIHSMKGSCGFLGFPTLESVLHAGETLLGRLRDGRLTLTSEIASALLRLVDAVRQLLADIEEQGHETARDLREIILVLEAAASGTQVLPASEAPVGESSEAARSAAAKIRVDVGLLDKLVNLVGELVLARNQLIQQSSQNGPVQRLSMVTTELQDAVMKTRLQPIGRVWSRFPRLVRDLCHGSGKRVRLVLEGRETELDKSIIEAISDPLTHLVRNAIDHGVEAPERRKTLGKAEEGTITLRASHDGGMVNIEVSDDGFGIDVDLVRRRAVQLNLVSADRAARMSEREVLNLIFVQGFTTSERVTTVSGRGVGMDVVRANVERIGGTVEVQTTLGLGTSFKIKIPLTLAIVPALVVCSRGERFAIPQTSLLEVVRLDDGDGSRNIETVQGISVLRRRGKLLPVVHLGRELFGEEQAPNEQSSAVVVLQADQRTFGLVVDEIKDTEEIVVKPLWKHLKSLSAYAGATVMGDGKVALILDALGLAERVGVAAEIRREEKASAELTPAAVRSDETFVLLCRMGAKGRLAIPLHHVARLEEVAENSVENAGGGELLQYRGEIIPLLRARVVLEERRKQPRGDEAASRGESLQVVVFNDGVRHVGLVVDGILDIVSTALRVERPASRRGVLGTLVIQERITELLDVEHVLRLGAHASEQPGRAAVGAEA